MLAGVALVSSLLAILLCAVRGMRGRRKSRTRDWTQDTVLITGGCGNIGRALHAKLTERGAKVFLLDLQCSSPELVSAFIQCDAADTRSVHKALSDHFGNRPPTILINNCAVFNHGKSFLELSEDDFGALMRINFGSYIAMTRAVLPGMLRLDKGTPWIVNVASCLGLLGVPFVTDYCASKFAVYGFSEALRMELKVLGARARVMVVCPFFVRNGLFPYIKLRFPWLTTTLDAQHVADAIVEGIEGGQQELWMPWFVRLVPVFRMLPSWVLDHSQVLIATHKSL